MFGICCLTFVSVLIYFPSAPPTPPAASCVIQKVDLRKGFFELLVHGRFWLVVTTMALPLGVYSAWLNVLDINLSSFDFSQTDAGWIGFGSALSGSVAGVILGRIADKFPGKLTKIIAVMYFVSSLLIAWFSLICFGVVSFNTNLVYALAILIGFGMFGTYPLFFELCMEITYVLIYNMKFDDMYII